ncbi:hypothetical protein C1J01_47975, partial [Nonomuraea aridisoli]
MAVAEPGLIPGAGPGAGPPSRSETAVDVSSGDSCRNMLPDDTPTYVVCRWLTPPQDAAEVAAFWMADDGANLEAAQPLPPEYIRCNEKTDLAETGRCKGGETTCKQQASGWYECANHATGKVTYEQYVNGEKVVQTSPPATPSATLSATPSPSASAAAAVPDAASPPAQADATATSSTSDGEETALPPDGNPTSSLLYTS